MAYLKRVSNAKNTATMTHNQAARFFEFAPSSSLSSSEPPQTVLAQTVRRLQVEKQDTIDASHPLDSRFILLETGQTLETQLAEVTQTLATNAQLLSTVENGGISTITTTGGITTIDGVTEVSRIYFSGDAADPNVFQTTAYTDALDASLRYFMPRFPVLDTSIQGIYTTQSAQSTQLTDLSLSYNQLFQLSAGHAVSLDSIALENRDISGRITETQHNVSRMEISLGLLDGRVATVEETISPLAAILTDLSGQQHRVDVSIQSILDAQPGQLALIGQIQGRTADVSSTIHQILIPQIGKHDVSVSRINDWLASASISLLGLDSSLAVHAGVIHSLTSSFEFMDGSAVRLGTQISTLDVCYGELEGRLDPLLGLNAATTGLNSSYTTLTQRTRFMGATTNAPGTGTNATQFSSALEISTGNVPRSSPQFSIIAPATDISYFVNWTVGTVATGIAKENDVLINTNCRAFSFAGSSNRSFRIGLVSGEPTVLQNSDLSINGNLSTIGLTCISLNVINGAALSRAANMVNLEPNITANRLTLDYSSGDTFWNTSAISTNFSVSLTNLPTDVNRAYTFRFIYIGTAIPTTIQANSIPPSNTLIINARTPLVLNGVALSIANLRKVCEITVLNQSATPANNFVMVRLSPYALP